MCFKPQLTKHWRLKMTPRQIDALCGIATCLICAGMFMLVLL
jgi:hypothetical protein